MTTCAARRGREPKRLCTLPIESRDEELLRGIWGSELFLGIFRIDMMMYHPSTLFLVATYLPYIYALDTTGRVAIVGGSRQLHQRQHCYAARELSLARTVAVGRSSTLTS